MTSMAKTETVVPHEELDRHPACRAWRLAVEDGQVPAAIEILKIGKKCAAYRLNFVGNGARSIIAKQRSAGELIDEVRLHSELLPALPMTTLELYGFVEELDGFGWLFLEDAGETRYSPVVAEHQALAVEWLGRLHSSASPGPPWLPDTGPAYFRSVLDHARDGVQAGLRHSALSAADRDVLRAISRSLETVEERWPRIRDLCARMPRTLVHGDFVPNNVRVRERLGGLELVAFDWEIAGVAPPVVDIALLRGTEAEWRNYLIIVHDVWPELRLRDVEQMARIGNVFTLLHAIYWMSQYFAFEWVERAVRHMRLYEPRLRLRLADDPWN